MEPNKNFVGGVPSDSTKLLCRWLDQAIQSGTVYKNDQLVIETVEYLFPEKKPVKKIPTEDAIRLMLEQITNPPWEES